MKLSKRVRILAVVVGSGIVVASSACGTDSTAPTPAPASPVKTTEARSPFAPTEASKALIGVTDGTYSVTFDPTTDHVFSLGPNRLEMPGNSVCELGTSGYGPAFWDRPCTPESRLVTLVVTVKGASSSNPQVDFKPAMRFNPDKQVSLYFYVPRVTREDAKNWTIFYCPNTFIGSGSGSSNGCVNEALTDPSLQSYIDYSANVLFRRLKHFSVYRVEEDSGYLVGQ